MGSSYEFYDSQAVFSSQESISQIWTSRMNKYEQVVWTTRIRTRNEWKTIFRRLSLWFCSSTMVLRLVYSYCLEFWNQNSGFERIPDKFWHRNYTQSGHFFPILNDRLVFVRYAKNNLMLAGRGKLNETSFLFYSSNIDCNDQTVKSKPFRIECSNTTFLRGTDINNLEGQSSTYDLNLWPLTGRLVELQMWPLVCQHIQQIIRIYLRPRM